MFSKLLKYEFRRTRRYGLAILLAMLCVSLFGLGTNLLLSFSLSSSIRVSFSFSFTVSFFIRTIYFIILAGLGILYILMMLFMLTQFYKSLFTDEGCLTFTLPVSPAKILFSKVLAAFIWNILAALTVSAAYLLMNLPFFRQSFTLDRLLLHYFQQIFFTSETFSPELLVLGIINFITGTASFLLLSCTAITIGSIIVKRHKIFAALGLSAGLFILAAILRTAVLFIPAFTEMAGFPVLSGNYSGVISCSLLILLNAALAVGCFFLCKFLLEKKLNLE